MRSLALPRTDEIPRYHLDWPPAVCPANPLLPDVARARGSPTQHVQSGTGANRTSRPGARRSGRSSGVNSGLLAAGGLAAGGPPSLCGDAVRPDLSVNAVVKIIAQRQMQPHYRCDALPGYLSQPFNPVDALRSIAKHSAIPSQQRGDKSSQQSSNIERFCSPECWKGHIFKVPDKI